MKQSRAYQLAIEKEIPFALRDNGRIIVQSPTGSGKSHIINKTVIRATSNNKTVLVLSDSKKIHQQLIVECQGYPIVSNIKHMHILPGNCYVAMTQTLNKRSAMIEQFKELNLSGQLLVVVDENHRGTMNGVIEEIQPSYMIGFSATPHYKWAKHLPKYYKHLIHGPQIKTLIEDGHLAHYRHICRTGADLSELKMRNTGEFSEESQNKVFSGKKMYDGLFDDLPIYKNKKTVIYVASIELCEQVYRECISKGYKACRYHSGKELIDADYELGKFTERNECDICVSVSALTLGWDYPPIDLIVLWRATGSLPLYLQMCGRGGRPLEGKDMFTVLDYGGNFERFGGWDMERDWNVLWQAPPKKRTTSTYLGVAGSKECPVCHQLLFVAARICDNCGYIYPQNEIDLIEGKLVEVQNTLTKLNGRDVGALTPQELALYAKAKDKKMYAIRIAKAMDLKFPKYLDVFGKEMGYKNGWADKMREGINGNIEFANIKIKI